MKFNSNVLLNSLNKVSSIVSDKSVVEQLRSYHFLPDLEKGEVRIAGTDSIMTLIQRVPFIATEGSDGSHLEISADKLSDIIKYAGPEVEFVYTEGEENEEVNIITPRSKVVLRKHFGNNEELIDFDIENVTEFDDEMEVSQFKEIISLLGSLIDSNNIDPAAKTIFFDKERAIVGDSISLSIMDIVTNESYEFNIKVVRMILSLLNNEDAESKVKLKKYEEDGMILVKTENSTFRFSIADVYPHDLELINTFEATTSVLVSKEEFIQGLHLVKATSEEDKVNITIRKSEKAGIQGEVLLESYFEGENSSDTIGCSRGMFNDAEKETLKFESLVSLLVKLTNVIDNEGVVVALDTESSVLFVREPRKKIISAISVALI